MWIIMCYLDFVRLRWVIDLVIVFLYFCVVWVKSVISWSGIGFENDM